MHGYVFPGCTVRFILSLFSTIFGIFEHNVCLIPSKYSPLHCNTPTKILFKQCACRVVKLWVWDVPPYTAIDLWATFTGGGPGHPFPLPQTCHHLKLHQNFKLCQIVRDTFYQCRKKYRKCSPYADVKGDTERIQRDTACDWGRTTWQEGGDEGMVKKCHQWLKWKLNRSFIFLSEFLNIIVLWNLHPTLSEIRYVAHNHPFCCNAVSLVSLCCCCLLFIITSFQENLRFVDLV